MRREKRKHGMREGTGKSAAAQANVGSGPDPSGGDLG